MAASRRCREKFRSALHALAVREGDVRERLRGAHFYLRMLSPEGVPTQYRGEYESIMTSLTRKGAELGPNGEIYKTALNNTLDNIRNSTGRRIAEQIYLLAVSIDTPRS